jgi:hypothetical protein
MLLYMDANVTDAQIIDKALEMLAHFEAKGFGMQGNGRVAVGAPIRVTANAVAHSLDKGSVRGPSRLFIERCNDVLAKQLRTVHVTRAGGNTYFYGI